MSRPIKNLCRRLHALHTEWRSARGIAAVEFALILPLMLIMYLGSVEITQALMASRDATLTARTLADLISQQQNNVAVTDSTLTDAFTAATAIMAPFSSSTLAMTITSVEFVADSGSTSGTGYDAKPQWTAVLNGGTARPCVSLTPVADSATPTATTLPSGVYAAGSIIVADIVYTYKPTFGGNFFTSNNMSSILTYKHSAYMRPRQWTGSYITYAGGTGASTCAPY